jgi:TonB family protein
MNKWTLATLSFLNFGAPLGVRAAQLPPIPEHPVLAQTFLGINIKSRCPDLRVADEGTRVVVVFWVPRRGAHSQITVRSSSGSNELDAAAVECVTKLKFAPLTTIGDGEPVDSWQQIAFRWAERSSAEAPRAANVPTPTAVATPPAQVPAGKPSEPVSHANRVTVHVCTDEKGKLQGEPLVVQSSGVASIDQAAVKIASAGSPYYRPNPAPNAPGSGCAQLTIEFEGNRH